MQFHLFMSIFKSLLMRLILFHSFIIIFAFKNFLLVVCPFFS